MAALLAQLRAADSAAPATVHELITAHSVVPQLLQLEQTVAAGGAQIDQDAKQLAAWVDAFCTKHEADWIRAHTAGQAAAGKAESSVVAADDASTRPAPFFFYLLLHDDACRTFAVQFLSALFTDPATDQDFYWLNDAALLVKQIEARVRQTQEENAAAVQRYARTKKIDVGEITAHLMLYSGAGDALSSLLQTRSRALTSQLVEVRALLAEVTREKVRAQWHVWLAQSDPQQSTSNLLKLEAALAAGGDDAWHQTVAARRRFKSTLHSQAFRNFLQPANQPLQRELAPLLVDADYSEESELYVDRLWSLATSSFQHVNHSSSEQGEASNCSWSYPPPSVHAMLDLFLLPSAAPEAGEPTQPDNNNYKLWLVYYSLLEFEAREGVDASAPVLSAEFASAASLDDSARKLIQGMVHMDAAYTAAAARGASSSVAAAGSSSAVLSPERQSSFLAGLSCFSSCYSSFLSQPDFPLNSSVLASVLALKQWVAGCVFFQNAFLANGANGVAARSAAKARRGEQRWKDGRKMAAAASSSVSVSSEPQSHIVLYSTLQKSLYIHTLMMEGLFFEAATFIRGQSDADDSLDSALLDGGSGSIISSVGLNAAQIIYWKQFNAFLLFHRGYDVLLKQLQWTPLEETTVLRYWKQHLSVSSQAMVASASVSSLQKSQRAASAASAAPPALTTADLVLLYHFEHDQIASGLRFYRALHSLQKQQHASERLVLQVPDEVVRAYAKLIRFDLDAPMAVSDDGAGSGSIDESEENEFDLASIELREVARGVDAIALQNRALLQSILTDTASDEGLVEMQDAQRAGSELNPCSAHNEQERRNEKEAAAAAAAAASSRAQSKASPAKKAASAPSQPAAASSTPARAVADKSPEKTPRVQRLPAGQSAAKAKRAQAAKEEEARLQEAAEAAEAAAAEQQKQKQAQSDSRMDEEEKSEAAHDESADAEESAAASFPSFATPSAQRSLSLRSAASTPTPPPAASLVPSPARVGEHHRRVSSQAMLISNSKPLAFSDLSEGQALDTAAFMLPVAEPQPAAAAAAVPSRTSSKTSEAAAPTRTASKRATRASKTDAGSEVSDASDLPAPAALPPFTPLSAHFTPSLLAPAPVAGGARVRSSRKRPLAAQPPMVFPVAAAAAPTNPPAAAARSHSPPRLLPAPVAEPVRSSSNDASMVDGKASEIVRQRSPRPPRGTRHARVEEGVEEDDDDASVSTAEPPAQPEGRLSRRTSRKTTTAAVAQEDSADSSMTDAPATTTRSTRRGAAAAAPSAHVPESNPFQRGSLASGSAAASAGLGRRSRTAPIFIDESLFAAPAAAATAAAAEDEEEEPTKSKSRSSRRPVASRASRTASSPSPSRSNPSSPSRPSRAASKRAGASAAPAASPAVVSTRRSRSHVGDAAMAEATPAAATRRGTRAAQTEEMADTPAVSTRSTRSKAK